MFADRTVSSTMTRTVQMRLVEQAAKPGDQPLLDGPQRLPLVFISSPSGFTFHLFIRHLGAAHCRRWREISIKVSYFILQQPIFPHSLCSRTLFLPFFVISLVPLFLLLQRDVEFLCPPLLRLADFIFASLPLFLLAFLWKATVMSSSRHKNPSSSPLPLVFSFTVPLSSGSS